MADILEIHPSAQPAPTPEVSVPKPKKKHTAAMLVGLVLLFGVLGIGVFFVANPGTLADLRSRAANGDRWKVSMGCVGTGCIDDVSLQNRDDQPQQYIDRYKDGDENIGGTVVNDTKYTPGSNGAPPSCSSGYYLCSSNTTCCKVGNVVNEDKKKNRKLTIRETPKPTNSPTPTGTPTSTPTSTPTGTPGNTSTPIPTNTPGSTSSPTPTTPQIVYAACNQACTVNLDCGNGLVCLDNVCRNATCSESATCSCAAPTPKVPVAGTGPSVLGASIIAGGFLILLLGLAL